MEGILELMQVIFVSQRRWYFGLLYIVLFFLQIAFTLLSAFAIYYAFTGGLGDTVADRNVGIAIALSFIQAVIFSWWGLFTAARKTAVTK
jgi:hypothetical protein